LHQAVENNHPGTFLISRYIPTVLPINADGLPIMTDNCRQGADLTSRDKDQDTPLHKAVENNHLGPFTISTDIYRRRGQKPPLNAEE
jgi:hypothetical protein